MEAIDILQDAHRRHPKDAGVLALLSLAYLDSGNHEMYLKTRADLAELKAASQELSPEDLLLIAQVEMFGNIDQGVTTIQSVLDDYPSTLALVFHVEAQMKQYFENGQEVTRDDALRKLDAVRLLMPNSAYVERIEFWANFALMLSGDDTPERQARVERAADRLGQHPNYPSARNARAFYFAHLGEINDARREWQALQDFGTGGWMAVYFAAFEYQHGRYSRALNLLRDASSDSVWASVFLGEVLALQHDDDGQTQAREYYQNAQGKMTAHAFQPHDFVGVPETILMLLGAQDEATDKIQDCLDRSDHDSRRYSCQREILEFVADPNMDPDDLLAVVHGRNNRVMAHKVIAFRYLSRGQLDLAEHHLEQCYEAGPFQPDAYWANAILARLRHDTEWRQVFETKSASSIY